MQDPEKAAALPLPRRKRAPFWQFWDKRTFRFNLKSFLPGANFSIRRFSIVEAAFLFILALLASRGLGVIRQIIFNAYFGTGPEADAYYAAARLPDTLYNLVAGGALTHAFIPVFLSYEKQQGEYEAWRLASLVLNVLLVLMTLLVLLAEVLAPAFVSNILVPGYTPTQKELTTSLTRILLLQPLILGLSTVATAVLSSKRQFLLPAFAIAVYNFGIIGGLLVTMAMPAIGIYGPTVGVLIACVLQVLVQIPGLRKQKARYLFSWNLRHPGLLETARLLIPNALAIGVAYVALIVDTLFTSFLPQSSLSVLHNAEMLQALPVALIGQAIGQSLLPHLSLHASMGRYVRMRQTALKIMGASIMLTVPALIALIVLGQLLIRLLFQHGAFDQHSADMTYLALIGYALAIPGMSAASLLSSGFFALKDALTPFLANTFGLALRTGLIVLFLDVFKDRGPLVILSIPLALAGAITAESILQWLLLLWQLRRRLKLDRSLLRLQRWREYRQSLAEHSRR
ncbi:MAG: murein biosynthesis integral membrane protein MurJ [Ktedonobacteraceae bacterium]|nr:murein biosynthesis integral membrane protein MurJ [Ktedonobacteraceae bacterium]